MGAQDKLADAVAALLGIPHSLMVHGPVFGTVLHAYFTKIGAVQPLEDEDRRTTLIGWVSNLDYLFHRSTQ